MHMDTASFCFDLTGLNGTRLDGYQNWACIYNYSENSSILYQSQQITTTTSILCHCVLATHSGASPLNIIKPCHVTEKVTSAKSTKYICMHESYGLEISVLSPRMTNFAFSQSPYCSLSFLSWALLTFVLEMWKHLVKTDHVNCR